MTLFVLGNAAVDSIFELRHLPRPGETLLSQGESEDLGGKGLNQAIMAARAGASVSFWAAIGDDDAGQRILSRLRAESIGADTLLVRTGNTDRSMIFVAPSGENCIVSTASMARSIDRGYAQDMLTHIADGDLLLLQGNLSREVTRFSVTSAAKRGARTLINPAPIHFDYAAMLPDVDTLVVNEIENRTLSKMPDVAAGAAKIVAQGVKTVVTTCGAAGALLTTADGMQRFAPPTVEAVDTTGAGDVFCGVLAAALAQGMDPADACPWAVRAAALAVTRLGTSRAFPDAVQVAGCRNGWTPT